jgi:hypothetical protein
LIEKTLRELPAVISIKRPAPIISSGSEMSSGAPRVNPSSEFSNREWEKDDRDDPG